MRWPFLFCSPETQSREQFDIVETIPMSKRNNVAYPVCQQWRYCCLAIRHHYNMHVYIPTVCIVYNHMSEPCHLDERANNRIITNNRFERTKTNIIKHDLSMTMNECQVLSVGDQATLSRWIFYGLLQYCFVPCSISVSLSKNALTKYRYFRYQLFETEHMCFMNGLFICVN